MHPFPIPSNSLVITAFWKTNCEAPTRAKKVLVAVHHPPYSLDSAHGGCPDILNAIDGVFASKHVAKDKGSKKQP